MKNHFDHAHDHHEDANNDGIDAGDFWNAWHGPALACFG